LQNEADALRNIVSGGLATKLIAVGIGDNVEEDELEAIASDPDSDNVFEVNNFRQLNARGTRIRDRVCEG